MSEDSSDDSDGFDDDDEMENHSHDELASQLASAGPTGVAAAAAISSTKKRKRNHAFETNPSIRKRQQTRLLKKLRQNIEEYSLRVGQQAVVLVATPGKNQNSFRAFGAKPLEDVVKNLRSVIMTELENALAQQTPPMPTEDPSRHELPPLVIDGIPTPVEKMTQAQLRAFIPLMLKFSTGRGKPGWGKDQTKPAWWPKGVPWANVRMDARKNDEKQKVSWTHALRQIVTNCYKFHGREDLLPQFNEDDDNNGDDKPDQKPSQHNINNNTRTTTATVMSQHYSPTVVQTISNPDGTVSIIQVDPSNPIITLPDGTTAHVQGMTQLDAAQHGIHTLEELGAAEGAQILIAGEDGQAYPLSGMITVPMSAAMYQAVVANLTGGNGGEQVQVIGTPIQLSSLQGLQSIQGLQGIVKMEQSETSNVVGHGPTGTLTITPVSSGHHVVQGCSIVQLQNSGGHLMVATSHGSHQTLVTSSTTTTTATVAATSPARQPDTTQR